MIKKPLLALCVLSLVMCSSAFGQFIPIKPSDVGESSASGSITEIFDISGLLGAAADSNTFTLQVINGFATDQDAWTVDENETTTFILGGTGMLEAFVNHGSNLGSAEFQGGSMPRDGITAANGETWTLTSALDADYTAGSNANDYFVDYTGPETNQRESNSVGFRWASDQPVTSFSVFSLNSTNLDNNYGIGFQSINAVPEPAAGMILAMAGLAVLRRRKRN